MYSRINYFTRPFFVKFIVSLIMCLMPLGGVGVYANSESVNIVQSQKIPIKGKVSDHNGQPVIGASVIVKGTQNGSITDENGNFALNVNPSDVLEISYLGFETQYVPVDGKTSITIILEEDKKLLDEVVVVAYGTQRARSVTGSMSRMNAENLKDQPVSQIGEKLQGKFSGVQVNQANGEPNGGINIRIRGAASINGGNSPLIVIDGFPSSISLNNISPDEIETITVLKDAASASLYGSRAANGVILITTKSAKSYVGKPKVNFSGYYGVEIVPQKGRPDIMNAQEFAQFKKEFYEDKARYEGYTGGVPECYAHPEQVKDGTDWVDILMRDASNQNYNVGITAGTDKFRSAVNLNYNAKEGVILETYSNRFSVRSNNSYVANEHLTLGFNVSGTYTRSQITGNLGSGRNIILSSELMDPQLKYKNDDGTYPLSFSQPGMFANPNWYLVLKRRENPTKDIRGTVNTFADVNIIDGLKYHFSANATLSSYRWAQWVPSTVSGAMFSAPPQPAYGSYSTSNSVNWMIENTLDYHKTFFNNHNIDLLLGYSTQKSRYESANISARNYPDDEIGWFTAALTKVGSGGKSTWALISYLARLNYDFRGKYLLSLSFRRDGCSRFGSDSRWANFPSASAGWVISDEKFMSGLKKLSFLKLRGSWGELGNYNIGDYTHLSTIGNSNYVLNSSISSGRAVTGIGNTELTWETTRQWDLGLDLGLFHDRVFIVYDFYRKQTKGLLYQVDIPYSTGFGSIPSNIGKFRFWGHEISLQTKNLVGKFIWNTQINVSIDRNKAIQLGTNNAPIGGYNYIDDWNRTVVGRHLGEFYGFIYEGVYMTQEDFESSPKYNNSMVGTTKCKDVDGDGDVDLDDKTLIGDPNPDMIFGITNEFRWRNFDASILLTGSVGNDIMNATWGNFYNLDGVFNVFKDVKYRWRSEDNPGNGKVPRTRAGTTNLFRLTHSLMVEDGSFIRLKNLTIGYTIPIKENKYINNLRVYFSAQNLLTFTKYSGMNPEISSRGGSGLYQGVDNSAYPVARVYSFGLNLNF